MPEIPKTPVPSKSPIAEHFQANLFRYFIATCLAGVMGTVCCTPKPMQTPLKTMQKEIDDLTPPIDFVVPRGHAWYYDTMEIEERNLFIMESLVGLFDEIMPPPPHILNMIYPPVDVQIKGVTFKVMFAFEDVDDRRLLIHMHVTGPIAPVPMVGHYIAKAMKSKIEI